MAGKVWLVGAGPSDGGLLTLKGKAVLEQAEVVVFDALVGPEILADSAPGGENQRGKAGRLPPEVPGGDQPDSPGKALEGRRVVRLKGGDPSSLAVAGRSWSFSRRAAWPMKWCRE